VTAVPGPSFDLAAPGRIVFGAGRLAELPAIVAGLAGADARVLVCTGGSPGRHRAVLDALAETLSGGADALATFPVRGEPDVDVARAGTRAALDHRADVVIGLGGGSVIDLGKAVAMLAAHGTDPLDHLEVVGRGVPITRASLPYVAVPTTAGTGAEATANAVLASRVHGIKASLRSPSMLPRVALVDPDLTLGCPPPVTASSGLDALTQCLEPFVSPQANPLTDGFAREGLRRAATGLRAAHAGAVSTAAGGPDDPAARADMSLVGLLSGLALANAKLGAVHGFAGVIGGTAPMAPHGAVCAALLPGVVEANVAALLARAPGSPALARYAEAAALLTGDPAASVADGVAWLRETARLLGAPGLAEYGIYALDVPEIVAKAARSSSMKGNPVTLTEAELAEVLVAAL
jgi:alcohol dehydrogenase class IV